MGQFASENKMNSPPTECPTDMVLDGAGRHASALRTTHETTKHKELQIPDQFKELGDARKGGPVSPPRRNLVRATDATLNIGAPPHTHVTHLHFV